MSFIVYSTVAACESCVENSSNTKQKRHLQLFPSTDPLEFDATDILGPLSKTAQENQYVFIIMERYSKLTRAILAALITTNNGANIIFDPWVIPYRRPTYLQTYYLMMVRNSRASFVNRFGTTSVQNHSQWQIIICKTMDSWHGMIKPSWADYYIM